MNLCIVRLELKSLLLLRRITNGLLVRMRFEEVLVGTNRDDAVDGRVKTLSA